MRQQLGGSIVTLISNAGDLGRFWEFSERFLTDEAGRPLVVEGLQRQILRLLRRRRDIAVKVLGRGRDPNSTRAGELGEGKPVTIGADDSIEEALRTMKEHKVRRLPVTMVTT